MTYKTAHLVNAHTIEIKHPQKDYFYIIRILENTIINVKISNRRQISLPTYTITPYDTPLPYEGLSRYHTQGFTLPPFELVENNNDITIETTHLKLIYDKQRLKFDWLQKDIAGTFQPMFNDRPTQAYQSDIADNHPTCHYISREIDDKYFGLGEKSGSVNKHGDRYRMLNIDAMGYSAKNTDPLYKHIPFYITYQPSSQMSYGIYYDDYQRSLFDLGKELDNYHGYYRYYETGADFLDYYVIGGAKIKDVTRQFSQLTGRPTVFPSWSASYSGSTMQYTDEPHSQERLSQFLSDCQKHEINVRSFHLSSGYTSIDDKRYVFNWNYDKFPDPQAFGKTFTSNKVEVVANIKPSLMLNHPLLDEVLAFDGFIKNEHGDPLKIQFWDDEGYYLDFTNPKTIEWWQHQVKTQLLDNHINCTWNDNNEFEIWDAHAQVHGFNSGHTNFNDYRAIMPLLMSKASRDIQIQETGTSTPYVISRSGCAGMSKYVQTWTGDNNTSWESLKYNNYMAQGLSLSGVHNFGHDIGGFSGPKPDPELFLRWVQNGIFYPRFSIHSWNSDQTVNEPWMHPEVLEEVKAAMHLHERLIPYFDQLQQESHNNFIPIVRPTFLEFEDDSQTLEDYDTWMLGADMLVSPIVEPEQTTKTIYLPQNNKGWVNFFTKERYDGGQHVKLAIQQDTIPIFIQQGSQIPMYSNDLEHQELISFN